MPLLRLLASALALFPYRLLPSRRRVLFDNLALAFPDLSLEDRSRLAAVNCRRTIELGLFALALPYLPEKRLRRSFPVTDEARDILIEATKANRPMLWLVPHFCHAEALVLLPLLVPGTKAVGVIFRPLENEALNEHVRRGRARFGIHPLSRGAGGIWKATRFLRAGHVCGMLFDQYAGRVGTGMPFFGRECSCTTLPDILAKRFRPLIVMLYPRRTGFWQSTIEGEVLEVDPASEYVCGHAHAWLERKLREDEALCASWLWLHRRWRERTGKPRREASPAEEAT